MFKKPYEAKERVAISFLDENGEQKTGMTEQCHKADCDINTILKRYDKTGLITHVNNAVAEYGDFTVVNEYQESLNLVIKAQESFEELPSAVRKKFDYDPGQFLEFATNPDNKEEMVKLGLAKAPQVVEPTLVKVVQEEPTV